MMRRATSRRLPEPRERIGPGAKLEEDGIDDE